MNAHRNKHVAVEQRLLLIILVRNEILSFEFIKHYISTMQEKFVIFRRIKWPTHISTTTNDKNLNKNIIYEWILEYFRIWWGQSTHIFISIIFEILVEFLLKTHNMNNNNNKRHLEIYYHFILINYHLGSYIYISMMMYIIYNYILSFVTQSIGSICSTVKKRGWWSCIWIIYLNSLNIFFLVCIILDLRRTRWQKQSTQHYLIFEIIVCNFCTIKNTHTHNMVCFTSILSFELNWTLKIKGNVQQDKKM